MGIPATTKPPTRKYSDQTCVFMSELAILSSSHNFYVIVLVLYKELCRKRVLLREL